MSLDLRAAHSCNRVVCAWGADAWLLSHFWLASLGSAALEAENWAWRKPRSNGEIWAGTPALLSLCWSLCISCMSESKDQVIWKPAEMWYICCNSCTHAAMMPWWCEVPAVMRAAGLLAVVLAGVGELGGMRGGGRAPARQPGTELSSPAWLCIWDPRAGVSYGSSSISSCLKTKKLHLNSPTPIPTCKVLAFPILPARYIWLRLEAAAYLDPAVLSPCEQ